MDIIYTPRGRAREYSPRALNIYTGCAHGCKYCYAPSCLQKQPDDYFIKPSPRKELVRNLERQLSKAEEKEQVLLSFIGDPYTDATDDNRTTRDVLKVLLKHKVPTAILTKGGERCIGDIDIYRLFGKSIMAGATLTFFDEEKSKEWEPGAASPEERLNTLKTLKENGIKTFASFEPVVDAEQSLMMIEQTIKDNCVDLYKIGKITGMPEIEESTDWNAFLRKTLNMLRRAGKEIYIKNDLAKACQGQTYLWNERNADMHTVRWEG